MSATFAETTTRPTDRRGPARGHVDVDALRTERLVATAQRRAAARARDLTALLRERPDLVGVYAPADFAVESVRWCA